MVGSNFDHQADFVNPVLAIFDGDRGNEDVASDKIFQVWKM